MPKLPRPGLHRINNLLFALIVVINLYVIAAPLLPQLTYWWNSHHTGRQAQLQRLIQGPNSDIKKTTRSAEANSLIIPAMMLNQPTLEGPESNWFNLLYKGIWRWPGSSTPNKGGNTVFLAHRFSYTGPRGAFYYLDKLKPGDDIGVVWNGKTYIYNVVSSQTVPPTDTAIENNTSGSQITLFTCTPLWHPVNRLVVVATLKGIS
ncbi:MAG TPA: class E sortase [Candidatus Saccharimonadales bacterium]|jgi:LPXTG-site transpeptidase (sortase) family protein